MLTKATVALGVIVATAAGAPAATKTYNVDPSQSVYTNVYNPAGAYVGPDRDLNVRFELMRDWDRGN
jgi:hypothetical protein